MKMPVIGDTLQDNVFPGGVCHLTKLVPISLRHQWARLREIACCSYVRSASFYGFTKHLKPTPRVGMKRSQVVLRCGVQHKGFSIWVVFGSRFLEKFRSC